MKHANPTTAEASNFWHSRYAIGLVVLGAIAGYFLLTEHLAHVIGALPFLLLLACPLMHVFMHHGHGHGHGHGHHRHSHGDDMSSSHDTQASEQDKQGESL